MTDVIDQRVVKFRSENDIPDNAKIQASQLYINQNFSHFCVPEIRELGGIIPFLDYYNKQINLKAPKYSDKWVHQLVKPQQYTINEKDGHLDICSRT